MNVEGFIPSKIDRERQILYGITYMWDKKEVGGTFTFQCRRYKFDPCSGNLVAQSVGKETACDARDPGLVPGSGRSAGEGIGYPLQYSCSFLMAQLLKNPPATWEMWIQSLDWEDPMEKATATHSSILAWRIPWAKSMGCQRLGHDLVTFTFPGN